MAEETIINIDAGIPGDDDINADWIKRVNGGRSQVQELAIHKRLAEKYAAQEKGGGKPAGGGQNAAILAALTGEAAAPDEEVDAAEDTEDTAVEPKGRALGAPASGRDAPFTKPAPKDGAKPDAPTAGSGADEEDEEDEETDA